MRRRNAVWRLVLLCGVLLFFVAPLWGSTAEDVALLESFPPGNPGDAEKEGIVFMREEEKLARDVYSALYQKWNLKIFKNIGEDSENSHMEMVRLLLERYNLSDPAEGRKPGEFENAHIQELYRELMAQGKESLVAALQVGAAIEDLDIYDLQMLLEKTESPDIRVVYQNLLKGSRNHLRSFMKQLRQRGGSYTPQHLSQEYFEQILAAPQERGSIADPDYVFGK